MWNNNNKNKYSGYFQNLQHNETNINKLLIANDDLTLIWMEIN